MESQITIDEIIMFGLLCLDVKKNVRNKSHCIDVLFMEHIV